MFQIDPKKHKIFSFPKIMIFFLKLFSSLILLEICIILNSRMVLYLQEYRNRVSMHEKGDYIILCLGDSITARQYPPFLEEVLNSRKIGIKFSVIDKGVMANDTSTILHRLESSLDAYRPDVVITMMGIKDLEPRMPYEVVSDSKATQLLKSFRIYKLTRLLWLHMVTRLQELKPNTLSKDNALPKVIPQRDELQQVYAQNKPVELNPKDSKAYFERGRYYRDQGNLPEAEASFKKASELNPKDDETYVALGGCYRDQGKFSEAEASFKKAIELNPQKDSIYISLGWFYRDQGKFSQAEDSYRKAIELNPKNDRVYIGLGWCYRDQGKLPEAVASYKKAIELNPKNDRAYVELGWRYRDQGKLPEAEVSYKKAIELNPKNDSAYVGLGWCYRDQGKLPEAEASFKKVTELNPKEVKALYGVLKELYIAMGNVRLAQEYDKKAKELGLGNYSSVTIDNYRKLKAILGKRGIRYVCMQYPMRNVEPLKKIFQDNAEGIIFVDNERIFKDALKQGSYKDYFWDTSGGDFGHCTNKGNRLLAENIANVILKEVFHCF